MARQVNGNQTKLFAQGSFNMCFERLAGAKRVVKQYHLKGAIDAMGHSEARMNSTFLSQGKCTYGWPFALRAGDMEGDFWQCHFGLSKGSHTDNFAAGVSQNAERLNRDQRQRLTAAAS